MRKLILILSLVALCLPSFGASTRVTATVTVTNAPTTNHMSLTINADVRRWTNSVTVPASEILTNDTTAKVTTNLYQHVAATPFSGGIVSFYSSATALKFVASTDQAITVTIGGPWASVTYTTNAVYQLTAVRVPYDAEAETVQTNVVSEVARLISGTESTNTVTATAPMMALYAALSTAQTITGIKIINNTASEFYGYVSNATKISGNVDTLTNGTWRTGKLISPTLTNGVNYGNAFRSPGSATGSEQFGTAATASGDNSTAFGHLATASAEKAVAIGDSSFANALRSTAIGSGATASDIGAVALGDSTVAGAEGAYALGYLAVAGHTNAIALGANTVTTRTNSVELGDATSWTHSLGGLSIAGNTDLTFLRYPITSLANGNNAAVAVGTNTFIEVSGPSAAFTISGIASGRDGKALIILNLTGQNMTIAHDSGTDPTAANRIYTMTGVDRATTGNGAAMLIYNASISRWICFLLDP